MVKKDTNVIIVESCLLNLCSLRHSLIKFKVFKKITNVTCVFSISVALKKHTYKVYNGRKKWISTCVTFVIFLAIMYWINVPLQVCCFRKCLSTWFTFMIFLTIMNWINMCLHVPCLRKWLYTWVTFVIFLPIMNWINMCPSSLDEEMTFHMSYICDLYGLYEF